MAPASATSQPKTSELKLVVSRTLPASRERVFRAWTRPDEMKRWAAPYDATVANVDVDLRVGGRYRIHMQGPNGENYIVSGVYHVVDAPKQLVYTWQWEHDPSEMLVTVEFVERGAASTELTLTHTRFADQGSKDRHAHGWTGCMEKFAAIFDS